MTKPYNTTRDFPDGTDLENQCARCGSSVDYMSCDFCGGEGHNVDGDEFDDDDGAICDPCNGAGGWHVCLSSPEWCEAHPMPGREGVKRGEVEWYAADGTEPLPTTRPA